MSQENAWLSVREVAAELGLTPRDVALMLREGQLSGEKPGGRDWLVRRASVEEYKRRREAAR